MTVALLSTARVTPAEVKEIIDTSLTGDELNPFINAANNLIQSKLLNLGLGTQDLIEIEKWLSAHFVAIYDPRVESESVGGEWQTKYQGKTDMGLKSTTYGQMALTLDWTSTLATLGLKRGTVYVYSNYVE